MTNTFPAFCDAAASVMLAACAVYRARQYGHALDGALLLGCLAGVASPVARDALLELPLRETLDGVALPASLCGALCGLAAFRWNIRSWPLFRWTDAWSMALAAALGCGEAMLCGYGPAACLLVGMAAGTVGGLARDLALGDTALAVQQQCHAAAVLPGLAVQWGLWQWGQLPLWAAVLMSCALIAGLRLGYAFWKDGYW
ncbi:MAG: TRIC cation channel family protein [Desulfovibrionaceae bacterium]